MTADWSPGSQQKNVRYDVWHRGVNERYRRLQNLQSETGEHFKVNYTDLKSSNLRLTRLAAAFPSQAPHKPQINHTIAMLQYW
jgi:hypothetical protein